MAELRATGLTRPRWERRDPGEPEDDRQVDLTDAGAQRPRRDSHHEDGRRRT
jgi:hypothetical protein